MKLPLLSCSTLVSAKICIFLFIFLSVPLSAYCQVCSSPGKDGILTSSVSIVNTYYSGITSVTAGVNKTIALGTPIGNSSPIATGDLVLIIQMQGADLNTTNTLDYGQVTNTIAGTYEYAVATSNISNNTFTVAKLVNSYTNADYGTQGQKRFQVIRVPQYLNATLGASVTAPAWNSTTGGVVVLDIAGNLNFNGQTIDVSGKGFRGGAGRVLTAGSTAAITDFRSLASTMNQAQKGEGIAGTPTYVNASGALVVATTGAEGYPNGSNGRGAPGNAGGGGNDGLANNSENSGGGGGANGGAGGKGGNTWNSNRVIGGLGGIAVAAPSVFRLVLGGGGGAGSTNDGTGTPAQGFASSGAPGGGMVIVRAGRVTGTGSIQANGGNGNNTITNDATGGGGAGGTVLISSEDGVLNTITVNANGGDGGTNTGGGSPHGPGGGGGGGVVYANGTLSAVTVNAGVAGTTFVSTTLNPTGHYGAESGVPGVKFSTITRPILVAAGSTNCVPSAIDVLAGAIPNNVVSVTIPALLGYDTDGIINKYTVSTLPTTSAGKLYLNNTLVTAGQVLSSLQAKQVFFSPAATFSGNATFTFTVTDNLGATDASPATYTIPVSSPPVANSVVNATVITNTAAATAINSLSATDTDGTISSFTISTLPVTAQGVLYVSGVAAKAGQVISVADAGKLTFDPAATFRGIASFTFTASDNTGFTDTTPALFSIPINDAPTANDITINTVNESSTTNPITALSASDLDGTISSYTIISLPAHNAGNLQLNGVNIAIGQVLTPVQAAQLQFVAPNLKGNKPGIVASFTYRATDDKGALSKNVATYSIPVNGTSGTQNVTADATNITAATTLPNTAAATAISGLAATGGTIQAYKITALPDPVQGVLYINGIAANTTKEYTPAEASNLSFDPDAAFVGNATFAFTATNSTTNPRTYDASPATYSIRVYSAPQALNEINDPVLNTVPNTVLIPLNAIDADGTITSYVINEQPTAGELYVDGAPVETNTTYRTSNGKLKGLTYKPAANYVGDATFTFAATDNDGNTSNQARYVIPVESGNVSLLPVKLLSFTATPINDKVSLKWQTAMEENNDQFIVERSPDGVKFQEIGKIKGAGNSLELNSYSLTDASPLKIAYYRLKQVDWNSNFTYSKMVAVRFNGNLPDEKLQVYPNPTKDMVTIQAAGLPSGAVSIEVRSILGHVLLTEHFLEQTQLTTYNINLKNFAAGTYFITLKSSSKTISERVVKY